MYPDCCPQMIGVIGSIGLPPWPWQPAQTSTFSAMVCASVGRTFALDNATNTTPQAMNQTGLPPIDFIPTRLKTAAGPQGGPAVVITLLA